MRRLSERHPQPNGGDQGLRKARNYFQNNSDVLKKQLEIFKKSVAKHLKGTEYANNIKDIHKEVDKYFKDYFYEMDVWSNFDNWYYGRY